MLGHKGFISKTNVFVKLKKQRRNSAFCWTKLKPPDQKVNGFICLTVDYLGNITFHYNPADKNIQFK